MRRSVVVKLYRHELYHLDVADDSVCPLKLSQLLLLFQSCIKAIVACVVFVSKIGLRRPRISLPCTIAWRGRPYGRMRTRFYVRRLIFFLRGVRLVEQLQQHLPRRSEKFVFLSLACSQALLRSLGVACYSSYKTQPCARVVLRIYILFYFWSNIKKLPN